MIVVIIVCRPFHRDGITVANGRRRGAGVNPGSLRLRLIAVPNLNIDIVEVGSDVLGKIIEQDAVQPRRGDSGVQHSFPLDESGRRHHDLGVFQHVNFLPAAPVAIGIVHVAAAGK